MDTPVNLAELALSVNILGVLASIALRGRIGDGLHHFGALVIQKVGQFILKTARALARDVVFAHPFANASSSR